MMEVDTVSSQFNNMMRTEVDNGSTRSDEKQPLEVTEPNSEAMKTPECNESTTPVFINHGAIAWNECRRRWIGDQSQKPQRMHDREPTISWLTTYEDLLSTNNRFSEPFPLSEMVDFLVDIWHSEGLYDLDDELDILV